MSKKAKRLKNQGRSKYAPHQGNREIARRLARVYARSLRIDDSDDSYLA